MKTIFIFDEDMIFQDDVTSILEKGGDRCGDRSCTNQLTQLYSNLYDRLSDEEKYEVRARIYEEFIRYSGQAVYDAMNQVLQIPNYLGHSNLE